jgi:hypothetical protein
MHIEFYHITGCCLGYCFIPSGDFGMSGCRRFNPAACQAAGNLYSKLT